MMKIQRNKLIENGEGMGIDEIIKQNVRINKNLSNIFFLCVYLKLKYNFFFVYI